MSASVDPLPLTPLCVERIWGGRGLSRFLGKKLPEGKRIGELWEAADIHDAVSVVAGGAAAGKSLREIAGERGRALFGEAALPDGRMPLLFKLIDAKDDLSVQLHPRDCDVDPATGDRGKEEAWYILHADKGAKLVHGVKEGVSQDEFYRAVSTGTVEELLSWHEVSPGEVYYIPPGTVHAIGSGMILAEIQQSSDTTYRIYDWGRTGLDGKKRALHIEEAKRIPFPEPIASPYGPVKKGEKTGDPDLLVEGRHFSLLRYCLSQGLQAAGEAGKVFFLLFTVEGSAEFTNAAGSYLLERGQTWLIPAGSGSWTVQGSRSGWTGLLMSPESSTS